MTDDVHFDAALVRRLVAAQFPHWADLPVAPVEISGVDNATYRLGEEMSVRLPRYPRWVGQVEREQRWLPRLAPHLPPHPGPARDGDARRGLSVPVVGLPLARGRARDPGGPPRSAPGGDRPEEEGGAPTIHALTFSPTARPR